MRGCLDGVQPLKKGLVPLFSNGSWEAMLFRWRKSRRHSAVTPTSTGSGIVALKMSMKSRRTVGDLSPNFSIVVSTTSLSGVAFPQLPLSELPLHGGLQTLPHYQSSQRSPLAETTAPFYCPVRFAGAAAFSTAGRSCLTGPGSGSRRRLLFLR